MKKCNYLKNNIPVYVVLLMIISSCSGRKGGYVMLYELVILEGDSCTVLFKSNSRSKCIDAIDQEVKQMMRLYHMKGLHLTLLRDGSIEEEFDI